MGLSIVKIKEEGVIIACRQHINIYLYKLGISFKKNYKHL